MSTTIGDQVSADSAAFRQTQQRCAACGRPKNIAAFARTRSGGRHRTCATCMRKASDARSVRRGCPLQGVAAVANATVGDSATAVWGVPTVTDVALEARIAGIAAALREAQHKRATLRRDWKIGQLQIALIAAVRMRSAAQIVRLTMRSEAVAVATLPGGARPAGGGTGTGGQP